MLQTGETYTDPGGDYYTRRDPQRTTRRPIAQLERRGHTVTLTEEAAGRPTGFSLQRRDADIRRRAIALHIAPAQVEEEQ